MIQLNGYAERWFAGAGALGLDGLDAGHPPLVRAWKWPFRVAGSLDPRRFTVVTKTVTMKPRAGRQTNWGFRRYAWPVYPLSRRSMVNAVALTNPGLDAWVRWHYPAALRKGVKIVLSLHLEDEAEAARAGRVCQILNGLSGVQINAGCPNLVGPGHGPDEEVAGFRRVIDAFQQHYRGPLLVKFRLGQPWQEIARDLDGRCAGYELINAVPWDVAIAADPSGTGWSAPLASGESPLQRYGYGGSLSGGRIAYTARVVLSAYRTLGLKTPVISGGGVVGRAEPGVAGRFVSLQQEVESRLELGAAAVAFSTAFLWEPWAPGRVADAVDAAIARRERGECRWRTRLGRILRMQAEADAEFERDTTRPAVSGY